jgi:hypothetical protein
MKGHSSIILQFCKKEFSDNVYVKEIILAPIEGTNILQEEDDENMILEEEIEMDMSQPKLGEELDLPTSPPTYGSNTETMNSFVIYDNPCYYDETSNAPLLSSNSTSKLIENDEECVLDMLYDNALDDGPMLIDNPPCLEVVTKLCEDKDDILAVCSGTLTHESPTLFLNSPNYTLEEKFAYVEKYLCDLQLSLVPNPHYNNNIKLDIDLNKYFERGNHANEFHNKFNDPLYAPKLPKIDDSNGYMVGSTYTTCNYYERGGDKSPYYATNNYKLQGAAVNINWKTSIHCYSFIHIHNSYA